ncbi:MAG TPA: nitrous oxide reductase accessory protein NosL [Candidatus Obscuribacterales bacterium]
MLDKLHAVTRWLMALLALALGAGFFVPLWNIALEAPQYPEGLGMSIWLDHMSGDLDTINGLNHYIGMHLIKPDSFAELRYMPWMLGAFIALGLLVVAWNRKLGLALWLGLLSVAGAAGIWDFWRWTWDYGHNLDPHAAIKVPGMSYQPPIFGSKQLLNFTAHSYPALGGWLLIVAGFAAAGLLGYELLRGMHPAQGKKIVPRVAKVLAHSLLLLPLLTLLACAPRTSPLDYHGDVCTHCRMSLADPKYGAELLTHKGKVFKFDSTECLVQYWHSHAEVHDQTHSLWVVDAGHPGLLIPAQAASYLLSARLASPMGAGLTAVENPAAAEALRRQYPGKVLSWEQTLAQLKPAH